MRRLLGVVLATMIAAPALAQCNPPPGLPLQPWLGMCGGALQQAYQMGAGQGASFDVFAMAMYQRYMAASMAMTGGAMTGGGPPMSAPMPSAGGAFGCTVGATRCTNGWLYRCQPVGTNTMWQTGAQRC